MSSDFQETQQLAGAAAVTLAPGAVLNERYRLEAELGRGGMGVVFRATDLALQRAVAVKVVHEVGAAPRARERLLREARAAAALNHPAIVAVHDVGEHLGSPFVVMELVAGESLEQARPRVSAVEEVVAIAVQVCHALEHAHAASLVHRDLKPANILLFSSSASLSTASWTVKLADLGLAVGSGGERITGAGAVLGTASYMAPEQALGLPLDGRADLYALGVVLYELATGRLPFVGDHPLAVVSQHVHAPVVPPPAVRAEVPPALEAVILRLLDKDPARRFASAADTRAALEKALAAPLQDAPATETPAVAVVLLDALSRGRLVGRREELAEVAEIWRRVRRRAGHCVLLSGEPGVGKTRLAREVTIQAALDGALVLSGACFEDESATPYHPFSEAFRRFVRETGDDAVLREALGEGASRVARLAPEIQVRLGPFAETVAAAPHEERLLFFDAVAGVLRAAARTRPVLLYLDDLHWADASSIHLLGHLLRALREERVLFLASYREMELERAHPLSRALVEWNRERVSTRIPLKRLSAEKTREQIEGLLGQPVGSEFSDAVHAETEGNPFFVEEVLKALIEQGSVRREGGRWERCHVTELAIPQSVKAAIGDRLDRVSPHCNEVLRSAAVLGRTFDFQDVLVAMGERGEDFLLDALDEGVAAQLLASGSDGRFAFTHDKIREVLYEELNPIRRRRLHLRIAEGLEAHGGAPVPPARLAHHYVEAGEPERGLSWARRAGEEAERLLAYDEAIAAYARGVACAQALGRVEDELALEEASGKAKAASGSQIAALQHFERGLALARDARTRARLQALAANSLVTLGDPRGLDYVRGVLEVLDPETDPLETAHTLAIEARFHHLAGRHRDAAAGLERAVALAESALQAPVSSLAAAMMPSMYGYLSGAYQHLGLYEDANRWARRAIEFGRAHGVPVAEAVGYEFLGENATGTGAWREGLQYAEREREIADRLHSRERRAWSCYYAGWCALLLGELESAEREFEDGIALAEAIGERRLASLLASARAHSLGSRGQLQEALAHALASLSTADELGLLYMRTEARRSLAWIHARRGETGEAVRRCEEVLALTEGKEPVVSRLWTGPIHVEALRAAGRTEEAERRLAEYALLVAGCQSDYFTRELARLRG